MIYIEVILITLVKLFSTQLNVIACQWMMKRAKTIGLYCYSQSVYAWSRGMYWSS